MDIHRSRFVPFPPSAINALAFSHTEPEHGQQEPESLRLAIGRANGNIEIWNPANGAWLQEKVFYGGKDRSVEGLVWTQNPDQRDSSGKIVPGRLRLFSIGYSSSVTEWDLATGLPARHSNGNHSEVWCVSAQPRAKGNTIGAANDASAYQKLVAGCADGTLVLLSTEDDDLRFERFVSRASTKKARALSVAYKDRDTVLAGFADSMIRVFDTRNGNVIRNISLGSGPHGGPKEILVWKVKCLPNGDFVSGDSTGEIRVYSGKNYSQTQRIAGHEADVLDLAISRDGTGIFSAGMDRRTCFYTCKKSQGNKGQNGKWRKVSHQRYHEHDVKAMATYEGNKISVVVSGGIDTQPIVVPLRQFGQELSRGLPALPSTPPLVSAPEARILVSWWNTEVRIWRVKPNNDGTEKPKVVARLALQGDENITSVSITQDGELLSVATADAVKLFQLIRPQSGAEPSLRIRKIEMPDIEGARNVRLTGDGKWLAAVTATNEVRLVRIVRTADPDDEPRPLAKIARLQRISREDTRTTPLTGEHGSYERSINHAEFSSDGSVFAVTDLAGYIDTWVIEGHEDVTAPEVDIDDSASDAVDDEESDDDEEGSKEQVIFLGQRWIRNPSGHLLPRLDSTPTLLSFQPSTDDSRPQPNGNPAVHPTRSNPHPHSREVPTTEQRLLVTSAKQQLYVFEVIAGRLSEWSRRNPPSSYPSEYRMLDLPAKGCVWDVSSSQQRLWLYGEKWLFMFDLSKDFHMSDEGSKKRKRDTATDTPRKSTSGAGDIVPSKESTITKMRKYSGAPGKDAGKANWVDVHAPRSNALEDDDEGESHPLAALRRTATQDEMTNGDVPTGGEVAEVEQKASWWHTFKYRPILGMAAVSSEQGQPLEVVLVERPSWDLDLPPRFVGPHEK
ncbi:small nucleolar ribonucleoprotein-like protein complex subunit [Boeremia exigua]|uniref:small nucleolar ribonucleoprotein-like protein complex subunit n=1 Tax=Boeremia exigua TaxID=749465 RepID=UPI001E8E9306|nr:small nucleolar ribonucleoprotein-like protein complex subunit [Boeremia exigua]KAH6620037.1 small nucleolar ribonucleoprotein-like protein complex subunit [Boeremia exigua]